MQEDNFEPPKDVFKNEEKKEKVLGFKKSFSNSDMTNMLESMDGEPHDFARFAAMA